MYVDVEFLKLHLSVQRADSLALHKLAVAGLTNDLAIFINNLTSNDGAVDAALELHAMEGSVLGLALGLGLVHDPLFLQIDDGPWQTIDGAKMELLFPKS